MTVWLALLLGFDAGLYTAIVIHGFDDWRYRR